MSFFSRSLPTALGVGAAGPPQTVDTAQLPDGETVISGARVGIVIP